MENLYFRFHRGGFKESMDTKKSFCYLKDMFDYIVKNYSLCSDIGDISISFYGFDDRLSAETFLVCVNKRPCGFMWYQV